MIKHRPLSPPHHHLNGSRVMLLDPKGIPTGTIGMVEGSWSNQCGHLRTYSIRAFVGSGMTTLKQTGDRLRPWATT